MTELQERGSIRPLAIRTRLVVGAAPGQLVTHEDRVQGTILVIDDDEEYHLSGMGGSVAEFSPPACGVSQAHSKLRRVVAEAKLSGGHWQKPDGIPRRSLV